MCLHLICTSLVILIMVFNVFFIFLFCEQCIHVTLVGFMPTVFLTTCKRLFEPFVVLFEPFVVLINLNLNLKTIDSSLLEVFDNRTTR